MTVREEKFEPKPGQVDFTNARYCPVVNCLVWHNGKILVAKRSEGMKLYPGMWSSINGFLDDGKTIEEKATEEIEEEIGIKPENIVSIRHGQVHEIEAPEINKVWIVHPLLVEVDISETKLNWETAEIQWVNPGELEKLSCTPGFIDYARKLLAQYPADKQ